MVITDRLVRTPLGKSLINTIGGALQGAGQGFMKDPKQETKTKPDHSWLDNYRTN